MMRAKKRKPQIDPGDCPKCGCNASELLEDLGSHERRECDHCGHSFLVSNNKEQPSRYVEQRIPICPVHGRPMHNNGRSQNGGVIYYACNVPGCKATGKGERRIV